MPVRVRNCATSMMDLHRDPFDGSRTSNCSSFARSRSLADLHAPCVRPAHSHRTASGRRCWHCQPRLTGRRVHTRFTILLRNSRAQRPTISEGRHDKRATALACAVSWMYCRCWIGSRRQRGELGTVIRRSMRCGATASGASLKPHLNSQEAISSLNSTNVLNAGFRSLDVKGRALVESSRMASVA